VLPGIEQCKPAYVEKRLLSPELAAGKRNAFDQPVSEN
jgi:hypothetical protein